MKRIMAAAGLLLALVLVSISNGVALFTPVEQPAILASFPDVMDRSLYPEGQPFKIAYRVDVKEKSPAVAFGGGDDVLAFEQNGGIYAKVSSDGRDWPGNYKLTGTDPNCSQPAVAYEADSGWFIVTYACSSTDLYARVFSPITEFIGPSILISDDASSSGSPAIGCNESVGSCLLAYESNSGHIAGSYITIDHADNLELSSIYALTDATDASGPRLAWGKGSGTYLLAYTVGGPGEAAAAYTHVHDDKNALTGNAYLHPSVSAVPEGAIPPGGETFATDVAYDPCTQAYLITLSHDADGDKTNHDLWAVVVHATDAQTEDSFPIADTLADERGGAIRFITGPACRGKDRLVVAYLNDTDGVMAAELRGNSLPDQPRYTLEPPGQHLLVDNHTTAASITDVTLSPGGNGTWMLIVYVKNYMNDREQSSDDDIWGRLVTLLDETYLPLVLR